MQGGVPQTLVSEAAVLCGLLVAAGAAGAAPAGRSALAALDRHPALAMRTRASTAASSRRYGVLRACSIGSPTVVRTRGLFEVSETRAAGRRQHRDRLIACLPHCRTSPPPGT